MVSFALAWRRRLGRHRDRARAARLARHARSRPLHGPRVQGRRPKIARFTVAIKEVQKELEGLHAAMTGGDVPGEFGAFLDVHWMILTDPTLSEAPKKIIIEQRCNAEWALTQQMGVLVDQFDQIEDPYLRERKADIVQVGERILKRLMGKPGALPTPVAEEQTILVAHDLSPADVIQFKHHHYGAFLTDVGGATSHTAIVARSLNVPAVVATHNARQLIRDSEMLIVDGDAGRRHHQSRSRGARRVPAEAKRARARAAEAEAAAHASRPRRSTAITSSCTPTSSCPKTWRRRSTTAPPASGCSGPSSCSSIAKDCPAEDEQFEAYRAVAEGMGGQPVTIRTFDLGADKHVEAPRRARARRPQPGARTARGSLLPRRAAALPYAAARHPARVALRPRPHPGADARVVVGDRPDAGDDRAGEGRACANRACRSTRRSKSAG